jgi:hypothetical protein
MAMPILRSIADGLTGIKLIHWMRAEQFAERLLRSIPLSISFLTGSEEE